MLNDIFEKKKKSIIVPCTAAFSGGAVPHWPLMQRRHCSRAPTAEWNHRPQASTEQDDIRNDQTWSYGA